METTKCNKQEQCVYNIEQEVISEENSVELSVLFKMFADPTRLKILSLLVNHELCVSAICETLSISQSTVSHQLAKLRANRIIKVRSEGTNKYYSLEDEHIKELFTCGYSHIQES